MKIYGKETNFLLSIGAVDVIEDMCEGKNLANLSKLFTSAGHRENTVRVAAVLHRAGEERKRFEDPSYEMQMITPDEFYALPIKEYRQLSAEVQTAIRDGFQIEVEAEPVRTKNAEGEGGV